MHPISNYKELVSAVEHGIYGNDNWYFFIIINPNSETPAVKDFLKNYDYLDFRSRDIKYYIPGFVNWWTLEGRLLGQRYGNVRLDGEKPWEHFDILGMVETVEWLEESCPEYKYREGIDLVIVKSQKKDGKTILDVKNLISIRLDDIYVGGGNIF